MKTGNFFGPWLKWPQLLKSQNFPNPGRMSQRAIPFSGKKKKIQLQLKKKAKNQQEKEKEFPKLTESEVNIDFSQNNQDSLKPRSSDRCRQKINLRSDWDVAGSNKMNPRENLNYHTSIISIEKNWSQIDYEKFYGNVSDSLSIPLRPNWNYNISRQDLENSERDYFDCWVKEIYSKVSEPSQLSFFEQNIEVWRQFWRVCEISDILVVVADIRNPIIHLPPSFYKYITENLKKPLMIVLTKSDLVTDSISNAWSQYLRNKFQNISVHLVNFDFNSQNQHQNRYKYAHGVFELLSAISVHAPHLQSEWNAIIHSLNNEETSGIVSKNAHKKEGVNLFTLGFIGQPNVGKSSLINNIFGKKVVSASRTPGHTKHFQTLHLSTNIRVCDCPGIIFPSIIDRNLQVLSGLYNIANVSDPYGAILYLAQRININESLNIPINPTGENSVFYICEEFATKNGFITSKAGRPDTFRAANYILKLVIMGKVVLKWVPPGYTCEEYEDLRFKSTPATSLPQHNVPNEYESDIYSSDQSDHVGDDNGSDECDDSIINGKIDIDFGSFSSLQFF